MGREDVDLTWVHERPRYRRAVFLAHLDVCLHHGGLGLLVQDSQAGEAFLDAHPLKLFEAVGLAPVTDRLAFEMAEQVYIVMGFPGAGETFGFACGGEQMQRVLVAISGLEVLLLQCVREGLERSETERRLITSAHRDRNVATGLAILLKLIKGIALPPVPEDFLVPFSAHIHVVKGVPGAISVNRHEGLVSSFLVDVELHLISFGRLAALPGELVFEILDCSVLEELAGRVDRKSGATFVYDLLLELLDGELVTPVTDDFNITHTAHVDVCESFPVTLFRLLVRWRNIRGSLP